MKGLLVDVYRNADRYDCTAGGVTATRSSFVLVDDEIGGPFEVEENDVYLVIVRRYIHGIGEYLHVEPRKNGKGLRPEGYVGGMMGGNFVFTSDSRFNKVSRRPLPVHDRFETQEFYNSMD